MAASSALGENLNDIYASVSALRRSLVAESKIIKLSSKSEESNHANLKVLQREYKVCRDSSSTCTTSTYNSHFVTLSRGYSLRGMTRPSYNEVGSEILKRIEGIIFTVLQNVSRSQAPYLSYSSTESWTNITFEEDLGIKLCPNTRMKTVKFESLNSVKRFGLMIKVLSIIYRLVKTGRYSTKRDIYYQDPDLFGNQRVLDHIVENISCMLHVPRWDLHIGIQVPNHVNGMHDICTNAAFILVIEKDATFQKLLEARLHEKLHPCIVITGKGFPDMNTRLLLRKLWDQFNIPVLVLVDADPHGIEIMAIYKYGSRALSFETDSLAVPSLKWLGLLPSDINRLGIPQQARVPLSKGDFSKANELLTRPYMKFFPLWRMEIETILSTKEKAEIQALDAISDNFLSDVYIPSKLRCSGWI